MTGDTTVVLLRAVNLGATNRVSMPRLRELLTEAGAREVSTFIASGNVICVPPGRGDSFNRTVEKLIESEFSVHTTAVSRTAAQLRAALRAYPFDRHDPKLCAISFLERKPTAAGAVAVGELDFGADRCRVIGRDLHLRFAVAVHSSPMNGAKLVKALGVAGTARNLRTVEKLAELAGG